MAARSKLNVVIAGGGVAALEAMVALRTLAEERVDLTLLAPDDMFAYRPLAVVEPFGLGQVARFSLRTLAAGCRTRYERGALVLATPEEHSVYTSQSRTLPYDALILASGARAAEGIPGAVTFGGPHDMPVVKMLLEDLGRGLVRRIVFAIPDGIGWTLPLYELALLAAGRAKESGADAELTLVTPEDEPLDVFGADASATVRSLLEERGVAVRTDARAVSYGGGRLEMAGGEAIPTDWVLTLPRLTGRIIEGIPHDSNGFVHTDGFGRVHGLDDVFAVGDMTAFPIKQGGIAAQQADAAAEAIAAQAGADIVPRPFEPVLRGLLLTGGRPAFLRAEIDGSEDDSTVDDEPLWWPAAKIAARYLTPYLIEHARSPSGTSVGEVAPTPSVDPGRSRI